MPLKQKQKFAIKLYSEHIEQVAFLYKQRQALITKSNLSWQDYARMAKQSVFDSKNKNYFFTVASNLNYALDKTDFNN